MPYTDNYTATRIYQTIRILASLLGLARHASALLETSPPHVRRPHPTRAYHGLMAMLGGYFTTRWSVLRRQRLSDSDWDSQGDVQVVQAIIGFEDGGYRVE